MSRMPRREVASSRARLTALTRHRPADPAIADAARDLAAERAADHLRAAVAASRAAQGLPSTVQDPATLERCAAVFRILDPVALERARADRRTAAEGGDAA